MDTIDIILLGALCCIIGAGILFRQHRKGRLVIVLILFCVGFGSVMSLFAFGPRLAVRQYEKDSGQASNDFREGVTSASKMAQLHYPYTLLSTVGLGLMALLNPNKGRGDAERMLPGSKQ